jgi:hypothetical protein
MKLNKLPSPADSVAASGHFYKSPYSEMVSSTGYDFVAHFTLSKDYDYDTTKFLLKNDTLYFYYSEGERKIRVTYKDLEPLILEAGNVFDSIYASGSSVKAFPDSVHLADFIVESDNKEWKAKAVFSELNLSRQSGRVHMDYASITLFVRLNGGNVDKENEVGEKKE